MLCRQFLKSDQSRLRLANQSRSVALALLRSVALRGWKTGVALLTALSFVLLISTAATHHHASSVEDQGCSLCSAVSDKFDHVTPSATTLVTVDFVAYALFANDHHTAEFSPSTLLPPSCGPPAFA